MSKYVACDTLGHFFTSASPQGEDKARQRVRARGMTDAEDVMDSVVKGRLVSDGQRLDEGMPQLPGLTASGGFQPGGG